MHCQRGWVTEDRIFHMCNQLCFVARWCRGGQDQHSQLPSPSLVEVKDGTHRHSRFERDADGDSIALGLDAPMMPTRRG
jgi:hypothetical protein